MKQSLLLFILCFCSFGLFSQNGSVKGFVLDKTTEEPVMFANVLVKGSGTGVATDVNGYFVLSKLREGNHELIVTSIGYQTDTISVFVEAKKVKSVNIKLKPIAVELSAFEVSSRMESARNESLVSVEKVTSRDIQQIPSIGGQADLAQYIQVLPGVVFSGDQGGQLYIRGGSAIQNKVLLDGMVVYNPFHSIGLFSVFETDIIRNAEIYTGGFNAQYGGRLSSVMDITTKDGNKKRTSGRLSASTFGGRFLLEGPIIKSSEEKNYSLSYLFTAKNSYLSKTSTSIYSYMDKELPYDFLDLYGKVTLASDNGSRINLFGFNFTDKVNQYESIANYSWDNKAIGTNFLLLPGNSSALVEGVIAYSDYTMKMSETSSEQERMSNIGGFNLGMSVTNFFGEDQLKYGVEMMGNTTRTSFETADTATDYSTEAAAYILYKWMLGPVLLEPSVRMSYYASLGDVLLEPRFAFKFNITDNFRLKAAAGMYSQAFIDTKSDRDIVNLFSGYLTVSPDLNIVSHFKGEEITSYVQKSNHLIFGIEYDILKNMSLNVEGYYKTMSNLTGINKDKLYADDADHTDKDDYLKKEYIIEEGRAYGGDLSLKYDNGRLYIWTIYSLGWVERTNEKQTYYPHYDRRHNLNILVNYQMLKDRSLEISLRWNYGSGFPYTPTASMIESVDFSDGINTDYINANGELVTIYGDLNSKRLPDYHRFDISVKKRFEIGKHSILELDLSVTNLYNRNNLFYYNRITSERVDQLPIMPSVGMTFTF